jgi:hypothetical protein
MQLAMKKCFDNEARKIYENQFGYLTSMQREGNEPTGIPI